MYFIRSIGGNSVLYLFSNNTYTIGRKSCDFVIQNDSSISRKHATITFKDGEVTLIDLGAKYNTFVNEVKLEPNVNRTLQIDDVIKFGIVSSTFKFERMEIKVTCSGLGTEDKKKLSENLNLLNATFTNTWTNDCTHVTVRDLMLTVKVLCALIVGQPIVTLKYWKDFANNSKNNIKPPNASDYKPVCSETTLNRSISLKYNAARRTLFQDKIFVFRTSSTKNNMEMIVTLAGGKCLSWEEKKLTKREITNSQLQYLFMADNEVSTEPTNDSFAVMSKYLEEGGKRSIPLQEIGLAVLMCSCEKDCNPNFDRSKALAEMEPELQFAQSILVEGTQSQPKNESEMKTEFVVPPTVDDDLFDRSKGPITSTQIEMEADDLKVEPGIKREADVYEEDCKRFKAAEKTISQNPFGCIRRNSTQSKTKDNRVTSFFQQQIGDSDISSIVSLESQSVKKRKADVGDDPKKVTKKPSIERDSTASTSLQNTTHKALNPFSRLFKPKTEIKAVDDEEVVIVDVELQRQKVNVVAIDTLTVSNCTWLSKSKSSHVGDKSRDESDGVDDIMSIYIKSFRNCIVSGKEPLVVARPPIANAHVTAQSKNFKTFKKVMPMCIQTTIVPKAAYAYD